MLAETTLDKVSAVTQNVNDPRSLVMETRTGHVLYVSRTSSDQILDVSLDVQISPALRIQTC